MNGPEMCKAIQNMRATGGLNWAPYIVTDNPVTFSEVFQRPGEALRAFDPPFTVYPGDRCWMETDYRAVLIRRADGTEEWHHPVRVVVP